MIRRIGAIIVAILSSAMAPSKPASLPGVHAVQGTYLDEFTGTDRKFSGKISLITDGSRAFVLTNAHLLQGERGFELKLPEGAAKIRRRWIDAAADVAWLEIEPPGGLDYFAAYAPQCQCFAVNARAVGESADSWVEVGFETAFPGALASGFEWGRSIGLSLLTPWRGSTPAELPESAAGNRILSRIRTAPGVSGSPLVKWDASGAVRIHAMAVSLDRDFETTYFVPESALVRGWNEIRRMNESEHTVGKARFRLRSGLLYLDYGDGFTEINPTQAFAGGGETTDGGGGETTDGGEGMEDFLFRFSSQRLARLGIHPGITWKGVPALALRIPGLSEVPVFGNRAALDYVFAPERSEVLSAVAPIQAQDADLGRYLRTKLKIGHGLGANMRHFAMEVGYTSDRGVSVDAAWIELLEDGRVRVELPFLKPKAQRISFELDSRGRLLGRDGKPVSAAFEPRIWKDAWIDLTDFYFVNLSDVPRHGLPYLNETAPILKVIRDGDPNEYYFEFKFADYRVSRK